MSYFVFFNVPAIEVRVTAILLFSSMLCWSTTTYHNIAHDIQHNLRGGSRVLTCCQKLPGAGTIPFVYWVHMCYRPWSQRHKKVCSKGQEKPLWDSQGRKQKIPPATSPTPATKVLRSPSAKKVLRGTKYSRRYDTGLTSRDD